MPDDQKSRVNKRPPRREIEAMRKILAERFPAAIKSQGSNDKLPLKVGIVQDVIDRCKDIKPTMIRFAISDYCGGITYHKGIVKGGPRYDLDGNVSGEVTESQIAHSNAVLTKWLQPVVSE